VLLKSSALEVMMSSSEARSSKANLSEAKSLEAEDHQEMKESKL